MEVTSLDGCMLMGRILVFYSWRRGLGRSTPVLTGGLCISIVHCVYYKCCLYINIVVIVFVVVVVVVVVVQVIIC